MLSGKFDSHPLYRAISGGDERPGLYYFSEERKWFFSPDYTEADAKTGMCLAMIAAEDGAVPLGEQSWRCSIASDDWHNCSLTLLTLLEAAKLTLPPELPPYNSHYGYPLPALMLFMLAKVALVSTPEFGPGPGEGEFNTPVMSGLERLARFAFPHLVGIYDFKGSSSAQELAVKFPDTNMAWWDGDKQRYAYFADNASRELNELSYHPEEWDCETGNCYDNPEAIRASQWFSYWSGRVRSGLQTLLLSADPLLGKLDVCGCSSGGIVFDQEVATPLRRR